MFKVLLEMSSWVGDNYKGVPGTEPLQHPGSHSSSTAPGTEQGDSKTNTRVSGGALREAEDGAELQKTARLQE